MSSAFIINVAAEAFWPFSPGLFSFIVAGILLSTGRVFQLTAPLVTVAGFGRSGYLFFLADAIKFKKKSGFTKWKEDTQIEGGHGQIQETCAGVEFFFLFEIEGMNACAVGKAQHVMREFHWKNSGNSGVGDRREKEEEEKIFRFLDFVFLFFDRTNRINHVMWSVEMVKQRETIARIIPLQDIVNYCIYIETVASILRRGELKVTLNDIRAHQRLLANKFLFKFQTKQNKHLYSLKF